ncbi:MAG TPA: hypothetical protein VGA21_00250 [Cyclobacteriaceae bacterium]
MKTYSQKTNDFFPRQIIWLGWAFIAGSAAIAYSNWVIGLLFGSLSLLLISGREGIIINFQRKRIKYYWGILGLKFGTYEDLPKFGRVTVSPQINLIKGRKEASRSKFEVRLWFREFNDYVLAFTGNHPTSSEKARILSKNLRIQFVDVSKSNGKAHK